MKKFRKGFTLLELLVVIGVMGILSSTAMIAGQQTTNAARATTIADNLEKAASAMMMYYSDNAETIDKNGDTVANIVAGANAYLKTADALQTSATPGKYSVTVVGEDASAKWWIGYTFLGTDGSLKTMIANKAKRMGLKSTTTIEENKTIDDVADYTEGATVYMLVR